MKPEEIQVGKKYLTRNNNVRLVESIEKKGKSQRVYWVSRPNTAEVVPFNNRGYSDISTFAENAVREVE